MITIQLVTNFELGRYCIDRNIILRGNETNVATEMYSIV